MKPQLLFFFVAVCAVGLVWGQETSTNAIPKKQVALTSKELQTWWQKDMATDTIPGISLEKAYQEILSKKKHGKKVIVAILDTKLDIHHEDIKQQIWWNDDEIPNNGIDDDHNGYIDDMHGWNFLGNKDEDVFYSNYESIRIIRKYDSLFLNKKINEIPEKYLKDFTLYQRAKELRKIELAKGIENKEYGDFLVNTYPKSKALLKRIFKHEDYTVSELDSLYKIYENDSITAALVYYMSDYKKYNLSQQWINEQKRKADIEMQTSLNFDFNERKLIGDNPENIDNKGYGNNKVWNDSIPFQHAIMVSGVLASDHTNKIGIKGVSDRVTLMPLCVVSSGGDEHDKDISLAIRYAVDNGAKIINISFGKPLSLYKKWIEEAIMYASSKDVVIICSAGNNNEKIRGERTHYPNDYTIDGTEISDNLIKVGATTYLVNTKLKAGFSNYSNKHIDLFAPGYKVYTTKYGNKYDFVNGTSLSAPIVSGVAALIRSYYPSLSAAQVKTILMESGTSYDIDVEIKQEDGTQKMVPFAELSKSGKVVNAYNALLMAEEMSK